jgi:hypothetical protein
MLMTIEHLYKYGRLSEHSEALFSTPTVWFSAPSQLNDPFECRPWFTFEGSQDQIVQTLARAIQRQNTSISHNEVVANAVSIFLEGRHRDPETWKNLRQDVTTKLANEIGLYCMSESCDSILMWSHYAADHCGYCLRFEATAHTPFFGYSQRVRYSEDFPVVDFFNTPNDKQVDLIFLTKYRGWNYEREWRIIDHDSGPGLHEYPSELLTGIIFGIRMLDEDKDRIRSWASKRGSPVQFYQAIQDQKRFAIDLIEVS